MSIASHSISFANGIFLGIITLIPLYGQWRKVDIYPAFLTGAQEGFDVAFKIAPHLVGMIIAIGMLRASGFLDWLAKLSTPLLSRIGFPPEILPMALMRPFSGGASHGLFIDLLHRHGADSFVAKVGGTLMGSTETTFYIVAVYFGAVNIRKTRHAIPVGLFADAVGAFASVWVCRWLFL